MAGGKRRIGATVVVQGKPECMCGEQGSALRVGKQAGSPLTCDLGTHDATRDSHRIHVRHHGVRLPIMRALFQGVSAAPRRVCCHMKRALPHSVRSAPRLTQCARCPSSNGPSRRCKSRCPGCLRLRRTWRGFPCLRAGGP
eukprot:365202-Chlamydomonas_euryale.AAC.16